MYYTIYKTTHLDSGWVYIGKHQTKDLNDGYLGSGKLILQAISYYGKENFSKEILYIFETEEEMNAKEAELVTEEFCSQPGNFNLCPGGKGGWGYINSNEEIRNIANANMTNTFVNRYGVTCPSKLPKVKKVLSIKSRETILESHRLGKFTKNNFLGKTHSNEWKKEQSERKKIQSKGSGNSQFGTMWITNGTENKKIKKTDTVPEGYRKGRKMKDIL